MQRPSYILTGTAVMGTALLLLFGAFLSTASAASPINFMNPALGNIALCSSVRLAQYKMISATLTVSHANSHAAHVTASVLSRTWRSRAGADEAAAIPAGYYLYASCIDSCNRQYWNDFDRKMDDLKNQP